MARYSNEFKERAVARLLPPERAEISRVSQEIGRRRRHFFTIAAVCINLWTTVRPMRSASGRGMGSLRQRPDGSPCPPAAPKN